MKIKDQINALQVRQDFLSHIVDAQEVVIQALIETHPNPQALLFYFDALNPKLQPELPDDDMTSSRRDELDEWRQRIEARTKERH